MAKFVEFTTPKRKSNGAKKRNGNKKNQNNQNKMKTVTVPQTRTVRGSGPTTSVQQELMIQVKKGSSQFVLHPSAIPWLSAVAPSHQEWCLADLKIWYEPRVGTTTAGTVAFAVQADFQDKIPDTLSSITRLSGSKRGAPWTPYVLSSPSNRWVQYVSGSVFAGLNPEDKTHRSLGKVVYYADVDTDNDTVIGNIFISYKPQLSLRMPTDPSTQG
ncbi:coat protein [Apple virus E]|nr:coat protein [Apple virus E]